MMRTETLLRERTFEVDRVTKGTVRFKEEEGSRGLVVGTLYVRKRALNPWRKCLHVTVTIEATYDDEEEA